ncbi:hypothetical protein [Motilimonas cestriensis]|uniref:hypothetical protein n=1 Tax=Motilimonas cestriensis TaxID=2742685 RepID=UPI003DA31C2B
MKLFIAILLAGFITSVHAHKVVGGVYAIGSLIEGEAGFSNGDMAHEGTVVTITNAQSHPLGSTIIDDQGIFQFQATQQQDHHFHIELGAGHVLNLTLPANELPDGLGLTQIAPQTSALSDTRAEKRPSFEQNPHVIANLVERAVAKQVTPLRKEIAALQAQRGLTDILGGLGYILGLVGLGMYFRYRQSAKV